MKAKQLLSVKQLFWQKQNKTILSNIGFDLEQGEFMGIIGPNGAGKTSLLRCLCQFIGDYQGQILFDHQPIDEINRRTLAQNIAMVAQQHQPIFSLTVSDVVRMGLLPHKPLFSKDTDEDKHKIQQAIEKVGLKQHQQSNFNQLSGGEQQRALIARALVQGAKLLIMDEPTNHLDVYYQHQIMQLVQSLNITVVMTIHDMNLAARYCQRLLLLDNGKLVIDGSVDQVLQPQTLSRVFRLNCQRDDHPVTENSDKTIPGIRFYPGPTNQVTSA